MSFRDLLNHGDAEKRKSNPLSSPQNLRNFTVKSVPPQIFLLKTSYHLPPTVRRRPTPQLSRPFSSVRPVTHLSPLGTWGLSLSFLRWYTSGPVSSSYLVPPRHTTTDYPGVTTGEFGVIPTVVHTSEGQVCLENIRVPVHWGNPSTSRRGPTYRTTRLVSVSSRGIKGVPVHETTSFYNTLTSTVRYPSLTPRRSTL